MPSETHECRRRLHQKEGAHVSKEREGIPGNKVHSVNVLVLSQKQLANRCVSIERSVVSSVSNAKDITQGQTIYTEP